MSESWSESLVSRSEINHQIGVEEKLFHENLKMLEQQGNADIKTVIFRKFYHKIEM